MSNETCIGFGEHDGTCTNAPDRELNPSGYWCGRCEQLRRTHLDEQFASISARFDAPVQSEGGEGA